MGYLMLGLFIYVLIVHYLIARYDRKVFIFILGHIVPTIGLSLFGIIYTNLTSGGVDWPWWYITLMLGFPIWLSIIMALLFITLHKWNAKQKKSS